MPLLNHGFASKNGPFSSAGDGMNVMNLVSSSTHTFCSEWLNLGWFLISFLHSLVLGRLLIGLFFILDCSWSHSFPPSSRWAHLEFWPRRSPCPLSRVCWFYFAIPLWALQARFIQMRVSKLFLIVDDQGRLLQWRAGPELYRCDIHPITQPHLPQCPDISTHPEHLTKSVRGKGTYVCTALTNFMALRLEQIGGVTQSIRLGQVLQVHFWCRNWRTMTNHCPLDEWFLPFADPSEA